MMDMTAITDPYADADMDDATAVRVEAALTPASKTSFCTDAYVKAGINAIALASATVTRIRRIRAAESDMYSSRPMAFRRALAVFCHP